nr:DNA repair protein RadC [Candidatus Cyanaurora vandensis]
MTYHLRICDLPVDERPRERLLENGAKHLATAELIAILLATGSGNLSALGLAQRLLQVLGQGGGQAVDQMRELSPGQLTQVSGIGPAKAATLIAAIEIGRRVYLSRPNERPVIDSPETAALLLQGDLAYALQEKFAVLLLDIKHKVIASHIISMGTVDETLAHPRDVFRAAVRENAARLIVATITRRETAPPAPKILP